MNDFNFQVQNAHYLKSYIHALTSDSSYSKAITLKTCCLFKNSALILRMLEEIDNWQFPEGEILKVAQNKWMKFTV